MKARIVGGKELAIGKLRKLVEKLAGKGLQSAAAFLRERFKAVVGVQAPRIRTKLGNWRALTPATPGAPPRRVSGKGQGSITWRWEKGNAVFSMLFYMAYLEKHGHPWMKPTIDRYRGELKRIMGSAMGSIR